VNDAPVLTFSGSEWEERFESWGWRDFEALWILEADVVEPANVRRGGWSSVVRLEAPDGEAFYLKRQENHDFTDWRNGFKRAPTVVREWQVSESFANFGVSSAETVCLGVERSRTSRGLLVTVALDGWQSLPEVLQTQPLTAEHRRRLWETLADVVRAIHDNGYRHNCLYGQHLFLRQNPEGDWDVRLIDLEKATRTRRRDRATIADLSALDRHTDDMSHRDRLWFWDRYFEGVSLRERRSLLQTLAKRTSLRFVDQYLRDYAAGRRN